MQRWGWSTNHLYKTASVELEVGPWWAFVLPEILFWFCIRVPTWQIPILRGMPIVTEDGNKITFGEYYGDLRDLFHLFICIPFFQCCYRRIKATSLAIPWEQAREVFSNQDSTWWAQMENDPEFGVYEGKTVEEVMKKCGGIKNV